MLKSSLLILSCCLLLAQGSRAEGLPWARVTAEVVVIALPRAAAMQFLSRHTLETAAAEGLKELEKLVEVKQAVSVANPAITLENGAMSKIVDDTTSLQIALNAAKDLIAVNLVFDYRGKKITTAFEVKNGDVVFLGAVDSTEKDGDVTNLAFIRVRAAPRP